MFLQVPSILLPGSKSITNRALLLSALSGEPSVLKNPLESDDTLYLCQALEKLGVRILREENQWKIQGFKDSSHLKGKSFDFFIGNAGTTIRFLTAYLACLEGATFVLRGEARMHERPIRDLVDPLIQIGAHIRYLEKEGYPPLEIHGKPLNFETLTLDGSKSSQYVSAALMLLPKLNPRARLVVKNLVSQPYIETTLEVMKAFGVVLEHENYETFRMVSGHYQGKTYAIPADASSASYFFAGAFLLNRPLKLNLGTRCLQGDFLFTEILREMGGVFELSGEESQFICRKKTFSGITVDMNAIPDTAQTLAALSLFAQSPTEIRHVANLRIKETDRLTALETELMRLGASVTAGPDFIHIKPSEGFYYHPARIHTYHDHRMAMSFAVAGLKIPGMSIENPQVVSKSFKNFFEVWEQFKGLAG